MSTPPAGLLEAGLAKIDVDLAFLMGCLRDVLVELGEGHLARFVPWTDADTDAKEPEPAEYPARLGQVYATAFQLLNLIEENVSAQVRRAREKSAGPAVRTGTLGREPRTPPRRGFESSRKSPPGWRGWWSNPSSPRIPPKRNGPPPSNSTDGCFRSCTRGKTPGRLRSNLPTGARRSR